MSLITWLDPEDCDPPHSYGEAKVLKIMKALEAGFSPNKPALIGYPCDGRVQLLSGTHRHEAARRLGLKVPVTLWLGSTVEESWGELEEWAKLMRDRPVAELESLVRE